MVLIKGHKFSVIDVGNYFSLNVCSNFFFFKEEEDEKEKTKTKEKNKSLIKQLNRKCLKKKN